MSFYDSPDNVEQYIQMAEGYDGKDLIEQLRAYLPDGRSVLEIGMGPGVDLDLLKKYYRVTGSDNSEIFTGRYLKIHPDADVMKLDAVSLDTDRKFDALYSNKVLHHLNYKDMASSLTRQASLLNPGGLVLHSFWYGDSIEEYEGLMFYQVTENSLTELIPDCFEMIELKRYTEMEEGDSLCVILRLI